MKKSTKRNIIRLALSLVVLFFVIFYFSNPIPDTAASYIGTVIALSCYLANVLREDKKKTIINYMD